MSRLTLFGLLVLGLLAGPAVAADGEFRPIFDGKSLEGWEAPDMSYWSVEDGAIVAESTAEHPCTRNQFLVWKLGELDDFELELKFQISGSPSANSGVQIRSRFGADGHAEGYQADIDLAGDYLGALYDEHTARRMLAKRGERVKIDANGLRTAGKPLPQEGFHVHPGEWNEYRISARGSHLTLTVNGVTTADVIDEQKGERDLTGQLALQIHSGPSMRVAFKDIRLKRLRLTDGRKKVVLAAGRPSHGCGAHEFNAGIHLLDRRLDAIDSIVSAAYHQNGWPKDPTALDNADALVIYADGGGGHPIGSHWKELDERISQGLGLMCMHYGVEVVAGEPGDYFKKWIGGYYEHRYSSNPHWDADLQIGTHPATRGVKGGIVNDEWYFNIRFRDEMKGIASLLLAKPSDETRAKNGYPPEPYPHIIANRGRIETLMWAVEREDGGRGVGFTGGHWHRNWAHENQRRAVLNAILWVAGAEVPADGVVSAPVSEDELNENLDPKRDMRRIELPKGLAN